MDERLNDAINLVKERWSEGDLAEAVRELFAARNAAIENEEKPLVLMVNGENENNIFQTPANSVDIVSIDWEIIANQGGCPYCLGAPNQDWEKDKICPECGLDTSIDDEQDWLWVK